MVTCYFLYSWNSAFFWGGGLFFLLQFHSCEYEVHFQNQGKFCLTYSPYLLTFHCSQGDPQVQGTTVTFAQPMKCCGSSFPTGPSWAEGSGSISSSWWSLLCNWAFRCVCPSCYWWPHETGKGNAGLAFSLIRVSAWMWDISSNQETTVISSRPVVLCIFISCICKYVYLLC